MVERSVNGQRWAAWSRTTAGNDRSNASVTPMTCSAIVTPWMPRELVSSNVAVGERREQQAADAGGSAVDPTEAGGAGELLGRKTRQQRRVRVADGLDQRLVAGRVHDRGVRQLAANPIDGARRGAASWEGRRRLRRFSWRGHSGRVHSPDRPPRFSMRRISPITISRSTAFTMS